MKIVKQIADLRKNKNMSREVLDQEVGNSGAVIERYEREEITPSVKTAKKYADVFNVTLDYLVDETATPTFDRQTVNRIKSIEQLNPEDKSHLFAVLDAFLRDVKTKQTYA